MTYSFTNPMLSRRTLLRGLGVSMALPWMESLPVWGAASEAAAPAATVPVAAVFKKSRRFMSLNPLKTSHKLVMHISHHPRPGERIAASGESKIKRTRS